jgi:hypothetical protein
MHVDQHLSEVVAFLDPRRACEAAQGGGEKN